MISQGFQKDFKRISFKRIQKDSRRISKGIEKDFKRIAEGFQKDFRSISKGFKKDFKRISKGFQKEFRRIQEDSKSIQKDFIQKNCKRISKRISE